MYVNIFQTFIFKVPSAWGTEHGRISEKSHDFLQHYYDLIFDKFIYT